MLKNSLYAFLLAGLVFFTAPLFFSSRLFFFIPPLIICFYKYSYIACLWLALFTGIIVDLFGAHTFFGLNAFSYTAATALLYPHKENFFVDKASTLPLMTFLFSCLVTIFLFIISSCIERSIPLSINLMIIDLFLMPLCDSLYAYVCFTLPKFFMAPKRNYRIFSSRRLRR